MIFFSVFHSSWSILKWLESPQRGVSIPSTADLKRASAVFEKLGPGWSPKEWHLWGLETPAWCTASHHMFGKPSAATLDGLELLHQTDSADSSWRMLELRSLNYWTIFKSIFVKAIRIRSWKPSDVASFSAGGSAHGREVSGRKHGGAAVGMDVGPPSAPVERGVGCQKALKKNGQLRSSKIINKISTAKLHKYTGTSGIQSLFSKSLWSCPKPPRPPSCECPDPSPIPEGYLKCEPWELGTATAPDLAKKWMNIMNYRPIIGWTYMKIMNYMIICQFFDEHHGNHDEINDFQYDSIKMCYICWWIPPWPRFLETGRGLKKVGIAHLASSAMSLNWDLQMVFLTTKLIRPYILYIYY